MTQVEPVDTPEFREIQKRVDGKLPGTYVKVGREVASPLETLKRLKNEVSRWLIVDKDRDQWVRDHVEVAWKELGVAVKMMEEEDDPDAEVMEHGEGEEDAV